VTAERAFDGRQRKPLMMTELDRQPPSDLLPYDKARRLATHATLQAGAAAPPELSQPAIRPCHMLLNYQDSAGTSFGASIDR